MRFQEGHGGRPKRLDRERVIENVNRKAVNLFMIGHELEQIIVNVAEISGPNPVRIKLAGAGRRTHLISGSTRQ